MYRCIEWNMGSIALFSVSRTSLFIIQVEIRLLVGVVYIRCDTHSYYARWIIKRGKIKVKLSRRLILKRSIAILSRRLRIILLRFIIFDYYVIIERVVRVFILRNYIFSPLHFSLYSRKQSSKIIDRNISRISISVRVVYRFLSLHKSPRSIPLFFIYIEVSIHHHFIFISSVSVARISLPRLGLVASSRGLSNSERFLFYLFHCINSF